MNNLNNRLGVKGLWKERETCHCKLVVVLEDVL